MSFKSNTKRHVLNNPELSDSVSEVDAEDMAKILQGADDIDNELFGFTKRSPQESKTPVKASSFGKDKEKTKKIGFGDFDDSDPLGDISLSDDDFYGTSVDKDNKLDVSKSVGMKAEAGTAKRPLTSPMDLKDRSTKSKLIKDLFGLDNDNQNENVPAERPATSSEKKKDDWLGIKDSPKRSNVPFNDSLVSEEDPILTEAKKAPEITKTTMNDNNSNELFPSTISKIEQPIKESSLQKDQPAKNLLSGFDSGKHDAVLNLLDSKINNDNKSASKNRSSLGVTGGNKKSDFVDDLFGAKLTTNKTFETTKMPGNEKLQFKDTSIEAPGPLAESSPVRAGQYKPSSGSGRRPGFGRRRDSVPPTSSGSPVRSAEKTPMFVTDNKIEQVSGGIKTSSQNQGVDILGISKTHQESSSLPPWLGGKEITSSTSAVKQADKSSRLSGVIDSDEKQPNFPAKANEAGDDSTNAPPDKSEKTDGDIHMLSNLMTAASALGQQSAGVMEQTENHLLAVVQMKQQQDMVTELCNRQKQLLAVQRSQIEMLVKQQIDRQLKVDQQMRKQQERINLLMQSLVKESQTSSHKDLVGDITNEILAKELIHANNFSVNEKIQEPSDTINRENNVITELEMELQKLRIENVSLEQRLESFEARHLEEIKKLEEFHSREILNWETREERLKQSQDEFQKDYEARITRLQENELKLIEQHNIRVDNLQKERLADLRQVGEFHRVAMEQVASVGKMLFENTSIIKNKRAIENSFPLDEAQLSSRELALIQKEKEFHSLKESLERDRMNVITMREELEEKLDKEKREYEEKMRQLKRVDNTLKLREEEFIREQERERDLLKAQKKQIEELRERVFKEQAKAVEERLEVTAAQARLDALAKLHGDQDASSISSFDLVQARAEVEGTLKAAKDERLKAEEEKRKLKQERMELETERWRLQEWEHEIATKSKHIEEMIVASNKRKEEGIKAMEEAKQLEKKMEAQNQSYHNLLNDLNAREERLMKEKLELAREMAIMERRRMQLDSVLPPLSPAENFKLGITSTNRNIIDPKKLIMKLKAEKEFETLTVDT